MCLALYIGADKELPIIAYPEFPRSVVTSPEWPKVAQRFHTRELDKKSQIVCEHFFTPYVLSAGSYEGCSCGFNYGREYQDQEMDNDHLLAANESLADLLSYILNNSVKELYACWFGDEELPQESEREVAVNDLLSPLFVFKEKELLHIIVSPKPEFNTNGPKRRAG